MGTFQSAAYAQSSCTPDDQMISAYNYPTTWKTGCVGVPYEETIYFSFPKDTTEFGVNWTAISYEVVNTINMPSWMSYDCNVTNCKWTPSNTTTSNSLMMGCLTLSGTPTAAFSGTVQIDIDGCGQTFIGVQCRNDIQDFSLTIIDTTQAGFTETINMNTVDFADASIGGPTPLSVNWAFGDGASSSSNTPTHTYAGVGTYNVCYTVTDQCGDFRYCKDVEISTMDLDRTTVFEAWTLAPNPAEDQLWIEGDLLRREEVSFTLMSLHGKRIMEQKLEPGSLHVSAPLDLSGLASGVYLLQIQAGDQREVRRVQRL